MVVGGREVHTPGRVESDAGRKVHTPGRGGVVVGGRCTPGGRVGGCGGRREVHIPGREGGREMHIPGREGGREVVPQPGKESDEGSNGCGQLPEGQSSP